MTYLSLCGAAAVVSAAACGGNVSLGAFDSGAVAERLTAETGPGGTTGSVGSTTTSAGVDAGSATSSAGPASSSSVRAPDAGLAACTPPDDAGSNGAPRQIVPPSGSRVTNSRPTVGFFATEGLTFGADPCADGACTIAVDFCLDRACTHPIGQPSVAPLMHAAILTTITPSEDLPHGVVYWRVRQSGLVCSTSPTWEFTVGAGNAAVNTAWGTTLDVNGDGFADVAVGDEVGAGPGYVYVYLGSASGLATAPATTLTLPAAAPYGDAVASAGDVNGDGFADLIVGVEGTATTPGKAFVYLGGASGLSTDPASTLTQPGTAFQTSFGGFVASAGDVNGDGHADVVVTAPSAGSGTVYLYLGGATGVSDTPTVLTGPSAGSVFGNSFFATADVNGDGYGDLIIGSAGALGDTGSVYVYLGSPTGLPSTASATLTGSIPDGVLGVSLAAGDVNGDGYADLVVLGGQTEGGVNGSVYLYLGGADGLATSPASTLGPYAPPLAANAIAIAIAGDVNEDGFADVVIGNVTETNASILCLGSAAGLGASSCFPLTGLGGHSKQDRVEVAGAGDVNGDGFADFIVGNGVASRADVFLGGAETSGFTRSATTLTDPLGTGGSRGFGSFVQ